MYLRSWAKELSVPILSIDYSLAPEAPFPRALEECFFVYAWCLNNFHHLGTNGKRVCVAGDSAGSAFFQSLASQGSQSNMCSFFSPLASANLMLLASVLQRAIVNCDHFPLMILWHLSTRDVATMFNIAKKVMARVVTKISICQVISTSRRGIKQLLGFLLVLFFFYFHVPSSGGKSPAPPLNNSSDHCPNVTCEEITLYVMQD